MIPGGTGRNVDRRRASSSPGAPTVDDSADSAFLTSDSMRQYRPSPPPRAPSPETALAPLTTATVGSSSSAARARRDPGAIEQLASVRTTTSVVAAATPRFTAADFP